MTAVFTLLSPSLLTACSCDRYYELDKTLSLQKNLQGKRIIEFPTLYIVSEQCAHSYATLSAGKCSNAHSCIHAALSISFLSHAYPIGRQSCRVLLVYSLPWCEHSLV